MTKSQQPTPEDCRRYPVLGQSDPWEMVEIAAARGTIVARTLVFFVKPVGDAVGSVHCYLTVIALSPQEYGYGFLLTWTEKEPKPITKQATRPLVTGLVVGQPDKTDTLRCRFQCDELGKETLKQIMKEKKQQARTVEALEGGNDSSL